MAYVWKPRTEKQQTQHALAWSLRMVTGARGSLQSGNWLLSKVLNSTEDAELLKNFQRIDLWLEATADRLREIMAANKQANQAEKSK